MALRMMAKPRRSRRKNEEDDPIVAFELFHWATSRVLLTVLTSERHEAMHFIYEVNGPYTSGDIDLHSIRRSERERRCKEHA